jgi:hypothetical protein
VADQNIAASTAVLKDLTSLIPQIDEQEQFSFLTPAVDMYLRLADRDAAKSTLTMGFALTGELLQHELSTLAVSKSAKPPVESLLAAEAYRRLVSVGANTSVSLTRVEISKIPDTGLRSLEEVMLARALLGVPVRRIIVAGDVGGYSTTESASFAVP